MSQSAFAPHPDPSPAVGARAGKRRFFDRAPQRRHGDRPWIARIVPETLDNLREHSVFLVESPAEQSLAQGLGQRLGRGALAGQALRESDRDTLYDLELLRIFRSRLRLVGGLGLLFLPFFTAFYFLCSPRTSAEIVVLNALIMMSLLLCMALSGIIKALGPMRAMIQLGCAVFCLGIATQIPIIADDVSANGDASRAVLLIVSSSFLHVLLSILLLPLTLGEAMISTIIVLSALIFGLSRAGLPLQSPLFTAQIFIVSTISLFVLLISYLCCLLRRRAFHCAFDLALQATRMQEVSATDLLTGGFNRRYIETVLGLELARAERFSHPVSLLMFDLDNFKAVNDTLGHAAGDEVLRVIWRAAGAALREVDTLGRFGGDEFLIVLPETGAPAARGVADRLRAVVASHLHDRWNPDAIEGRVTLSIGVLTLDGSNLINVETALLRADALLYNAKRSGKNCTVMG